MLDYNFYKHRNNDSSTSYTIKNTKLTFSHNPESNTLSIEANREVIMQIDLTPCAADVKEAVKSNGSGQEKPLIWHAEENGWHFTFACTNASLKNQGNAFQSANFKVFLSLP